ncbi:MetQ/NlpA family ABC transporter substrate-binding protein [Corticibacter populi]|uniref:MetQ/NlpA family ABC transporter substrate-binding protein n=1 Tax=Corticibacter populi TaxID=1550736 RepID=A0A3M6QXF3_9BURK|nr:MetQ/NlpA family ABC transporter substrate-binding protein [Corticibacter populi]RMX07705.1 MetQ/NlpA family ABC transporter substrate-binding protein [Corticibacter populi]RZS30220.1 D-methionine transport system substrate-binding protein [Corticibacter populi]
MLGPLRKAVWLAVGAALFSGAAWAAPLKIGVTPGAIADSIETAAEEARQQGLEVEVVEFSEWRGPNTALAAGDLDANYFQHLPFLANAARDGNYRFAPVAVGLLPNVGLFSLKVSSFADLTEGARVAVASDPANQGRGLLLLERSGLIALAPGKGAAATLDDVTANPKKLRFVEVDGPQLVRSLEDVDLAYGVTSHYVAAGKADIADRHGLLFSGVDDVQWAIHFVTREDNQDDARLRKFIEIYHSAPAVRERIHASYANNDRFYSLPWVK